MPTKKTYITPPDADCPVDGPIFLGSVLKHPLKPYEPLNDQSRVAINPPEKTYITEKHNWTGRHSVTNDIELGIYLQLLSSLLGVGGDLSTSRSKNELAGYKVDRLLTEWFVPSAAYLDQCLRATPVFADIKKRFGPALYIVSGLKLAYGISAEEVKGKGHGVKIQMGVNTTPVGGPGEIGPKASVNTAREDSVTFESSSDIVLAYQLRRIYYNRKTDSLSSEVHDDKKHVSLSRPRYRESDSPDNEDEDDDEDGDEDSDQEFNDFEVQGVAHEDFGATQVGKDAIVASGMDEGGNEYDIIRSVSTS